MIEKLIRNRGRPLINLIKGLRTLRGTVCNFEIIFDPGNKMILERSLDCLVEKIWGEEFVDICSWEVGREWLVSMVSVNLEVSGGA